MKTLFSIDIDKQVFNDEIISKTVYWQSAEFVIDRKVKSNVETITFQTSDNNSSKIDVELVMSKFNQKLNDFKLRQIIEEETKDIRTILYIKAFANNDDFEDYE